jgi:hypothetical protein
LHSSFLFLGVGNDKCVFSLLFSTFCFFLGLSLFGLESRFKSLISIDPYVFERRRLDLLHSFEEPSPLFDGDDVDSLLSRFLLLRATHSPDTSGS